MTTNSNQYQLFEDVAAEQPPTEHQPEDRPDRIGQAAIEYKPTSAILTKATGFMDAYNYTLNPYSGCSYGCTYCYAAFFSRDREKQDSWGYWVSVKENAVEKLKNLKRSLDDQLIYMSSVTDPYQPIERELKITRDLLNIMAERNTNPNWSYKRAAPMSCATATCFASHRRQRRARAGEYDSHH